MEEGRDWSEEQEQPTFDPGDDSHLIEEGEKLSEDLMGEVAVAARGLALARVSATAAKKVEAEFLKSLETALPYIGYQEAVAIRKSAAANEAELKAKLKKAMLKANEELGETDFVSGKVITRKKITIVDRMKATAWARENAPFLMILDDKALLAIAREVQPDGVETGEEKDTSINSDLSALLEVDDETF